MMRLAKVTAACALWCTRALATPSTEDVESGIADAESLAMTWTSSPDAARRAFGLRMLVTLASPRWPEARERLLGDTDPLVRAALLDGIAWMGDESAGATDLAWCTLAAATMRNDIYLALAALAGSNQRVPLARLESAVPAPFRDDTAQSIYLGLRRILEPDDPDLYQILEDEALRKGVEELLASNNKEDDKKKYLQSKFDYARRSRVMAIADRDRLHGLLRGGDDVERAAAASRLLDMRDAECLAWLDAQARQGHFYAGVDFTGNPSWLVDWIKAAPALSTEAVVSLLWDLRQSGNRPFIDAFVCELGRRKAAPDAAAILARTEGASDAAAMRSKVSYMLGEWEVVEQATRDALSGPTDEWPVRRNLAALESAIASQPGQVLLMPSRARKAMFEIVWGAWRARRDKATESTTKDPRTREPFVSGDGASAPHLAGELADGANFDVMWRSWIEEKDDLFRRLLLRGLLCSPDPRAATLRERLFKDAPPEIRGMVQDAIPLESVLDRPVGSFLPGASNYYRWTQTAYEELPLLNMLPTLATWRGTPPEAPMADAFAQELPAAGREALWRGARRQALQALLRRAGVAPGDAIADRRRTIRHLGWLLETDRCGGQVPLSSVAERYANVADQSDRWLAMLRAQPTVPNVVAAPLDPAKVADLATILDPAAGQSEWKRKVDALVDRLRHPDSYIVCYGGYKEPDLVPDARDPGFRALGAPARAHVESHLAGEDMRLRHLISVLLWKVYLDEAGLKKLMADARGGDAATRESALRHLALVRFREAEQLFVEALDSDDPKMRCAGLAGIERLRVARLLPKVETMVLDPDVKVVQTACAVLHQLHEPESWRVLVPLLDSEPVDVRTSAALAALVPFRRSEVLRALVDRIPRLSWAALGALTQMTGCTNPAPSADRSDLTSERRFWAEWLARNEHRAVADWIKEGVAQRVAILGDVPEREGIPPWRLGYYAGPGLPLHGKRHDVEVWWEGAKDSPYLDVLWSGIERDAAEGFDPERQSVRLLVEFFPDRAQRLLLDVMARADDAHATSVHDALAELAGADFGNPAAVIRELRGQVLERWRAWGEGRR